MTSISEQPDHRPEAEGIGISAVERDTGIRRETLRIWERRYGFPQPGRDGAGERLYPASQVARLRLIKRLLDAGHRPGRVVLASEAQLQGWLSAPSSATSATSSPRRGTAALARAAALPGALPVVDAGPLANDIAECLARLKRHDVDGLRQALTQALLRQGLAGAVTQLFAPLIQAVGDAWMRGELQVFEEHVFSESLQLVLRQALQSLPAPATQPGPRVLLTTLPGESHVLGLLMAEALLCLDGCTCLSLGAQTPPEQIGPAVAAHRADVVALSFSAVLATRAVHDGLGRLRALLPAAVEVWAGGSNRALASPSRPTGVRVLPGLAQISDEVGRWRAAHD
jgi:methanogenic corrinoid protein MtbC1